jgi:hypothetical protein
MVKISFYWLTSKRKMNSVLEMTVVEAINGYIFDYLDTLWVMAEEKSLHQ